MTLSPAFLAMNSKLRTAALWLITLVGLLACSSGGTGAPKPDAHCHTDAECGEQHCDPKSGCVACVFDSHCSPGERCSGGACYKPTSCASDQDCSGDFPVCNPASRECVRCLTDSQCGDSAHCRDGACTPYSKCEAEKDCLNGTHCDLGSGECVSCLTKGDCAVGSDCVQGRCQQLCGSETDCTATGQHCTSKGHCDECANDSQCPDVYHCASGTCVRDVCAQGKTSCASDGASVTTCSANGDGVVASACAGGQSCAMVNDAAACQPWICGPGSNRCSGDGASVERCAKDGLSIQMQVPCADGEHCVNGRCAKQSCEPNASFCDKGASYACSFDGTMATLLKQCEANEQCDPGTGKCVAQACVPGKTVCRDNDLGTCRDDGFGYDYAACPGGQACVDGACQEQVCAAGYSYCDGADVRSCNSTGTDSSLQETCPGGCETTGGFASCKVVKCTAGAPVCDGTRATACKQDGSGPEPNGVDCPSLNAYCDGGICKPNACTPSARFCQGETPYQCSADGRTSSAATYYACTAYSSSQHCNPATGTCGTYACTPNTAYCSNNAAYMCDSTGFIGTAVEDCSASNKICSAGKCVAKACEPGYFCKEGNVYYCSGGISSSLYTTCQPSQYCVAGSGYCYQDVCQAGQPICNGNALSTCASDGSGPADAGKACGANKVCVTDSCKDVTCTASTTFCQNGHVQRCNDTGTAATLSQYCVNETYCDVASATCKPDVCTGGQAYCEGETFKTCKADGSGSVDAGTVCSTSSKVCTLTGCAASALEVLGSSGTLYSDYYGRMYGNVIKVTQKRKLTKLEADLTITTGPANVHWLVYSSTNGSTFYLASDTTTSLAVAADAWVGSGALNVTLEAGLYYWIGFELPGTTGSGGASVSYHSGPGSTALSFAQLLGSSAQDASLPPANLSSAPPLAQNLYYLRLSSTLP